MARYTEFHKRLNSHSIALLNKQTSHIATGLLVDIGVAKVVFTVAHILEQVDPKVNPDDLLIALGVSPQRYPMKKAKIWQDNNLDIAYIELNRFEAEIFRGDGVEFFLPSKGMSRNVLDKALRCAVCGFPSKQSSYDHTENIVQVSTCLVTTLPPLSYELWPEEIKTGGKNQRVNFLLKHGPKQFTYTLNEEGIPTSPVDPRGLSGAGVWIFDPETETNGTPEYSLFGIQTGFYRTHDLLVGTTVEPLMRQIERDYQISLSG